jgi:hypothetical protein
MKPNGLIRLFAFAVLILVIGLACSGGAPQPTATVFVPPPTLTPVPARPTPTPAVPPTPVPQDASNNTNNTNSSNNTDNNSSGGWSTFTDQNKLFAIDIPSDWTYQQTVDEQNNYYYIDTFTSPDGGAVVESIVYDDGQPVTGNFKSRAALFFLNNWYSYTGKEGDIRVSDDRMQADGSERLVWTSKGGGYSGVSFLETRGRTTFLFFTLNWGNGYEDQYSDIVDAVIKSYHIP